MESEGPARDPLEDLDRELYSKNVDGMRRPDITLPRRGFDAPKMWEHVETVKNTVKDVSKKTSVFKKFFAFSVIFFVAALSFGAYMFFGGGNTVSSDNIIINVLGNAFTSGGEELPLEIEIANKNNVAFSYTNLIVEYPRGDTTDPSAGSMERKQIDTGPLGGGATHTEHVPITLFGQEGTTKDVTLTLEYRVQGSNATFKKQKIYTVNINSAPISLLVDAPKNVNPNQQFTFKINVISNAKNKLPNMLVHIDYPTGFRFAKADPSPTYLSTAWNIGDLDPGQSKVITVSGSLAAAQGEERSFRIFAGTASDSDRNTVGVVFNSFLYTTLIEQPFLNAKLTINGDTADTVTVFPKQQIHGEIHWSNNLGTPIRDAELKVKFSGDVLNLSSIVPAQGFYNSNDKTITWNKDTFSQFASLDPGESGTVSFAFASLPLLKSDRTIYDNPQITVGVSIKGRAPEEGDIVKNVDNFEQKIVKIATDFQVTEQSLRNSGPFTNTGPIPPRVGEKSTYTILWTASSSASSVSGAVARASLPSYVHFIGAPNPSSENLALDPATGEVVWKIGTVQKGTGFTSGPRQVYFQVEITPSSSQVASAPILVGELKATGTDSYTTKTLDTRYNQVTTATLNDSGYSQEMGKVVQ